jgi:hypothetical protein
VQSRVGPNETIPWNAPFKGLAQMVRRCENGSKKLLRERWMDLATVDGRVAPMGYAPH